MLNDLFWLFYQEYKMLWSRINKYAFLIGFTRIWYASSRLIFAWVSYIDTCTVFDTELSDSNIYFLISLITNGVQHYVIKFVSDLRQVGGFVRVLWFHPPIKLTSRYNWNIVESGVKAHQANNLSLTFNVGVCVVL
jgi:hypothetical protein